MKEDDGTDLPCPACGGFSYPWGWIQAHQFKFVPDDASFWDRYIRGGWRLRGRRCEECGNLQIFTGPPPSRGIKRTRNAAEADLS